MSRSQGLVIRGNLSSSEVPIYGTLGYPEILARSRGISTYILALALVQFH